MVRTAYDAIVIGGGISALTAALQLQIRGYAVAVIDKPGGEGASSLPGGLANPAYGREAKKSWQADACIESLNRLSELLGDVSAGHGIIKKGVLRPATTEEQAHVFRESPGKHHWKEEWIEWLEPAQAAGRFPQIMTKNGALWIQAGITIDLPSLLAAIRTALLMRGAYLVSASKIMVHDGAGSHTVLADEREFMASEIIFAPGPGISDYPQWSLLKFNRVKGQVMAAEFSGAGEPGCSVASSGYAAFTGTNRVVVGSTYEHSFTDSEPSEGTGRELESRFGKMCPGIAGGLINTQPWAGIRLTTPDRKPCVGRHWDIGGFYCIAGMGSRGLLMAPRVAELLADHIRTKQKLPDEIDTARYYRTRRFMNRV